jgi:hypothetical protein
MLRNKIKKLYNKYSKKIPILAGCFIMPFDANTEKLLEVKATKGSRLAPIPIEKKLCKSVK